MASPTDTRTLTTTALLTAMALAVQYLESLLPPILPGIPVRIGLANIFVLLPLLARRKGAAAAISLLRCLLLPLITGNVSGLPYALAGSAASLLGMLSLLPPYRAGRVGAVGVSVAGAFLFNMGQLAVGVCVAGKAMLAYVPWMGLCSIPAGVATGLLAALLKKRLRYDSVVTVPNDTSV